MCLVKRLYVGVLSGPSRIHLQPLEGLHPQWSASYRGCLPKTENCPRSVSLQGNLYLLCDQQRSPHPMPTWNNSARMSWPKSSLGNQLRPLLALHPSSTFPLPNPLPSAPFTRHKPPKTLANISCPLIANLHLRAPFSGNLNYDILWLGATSHCNIETMIVLTPRAVVQVR